MGVTEPRMTLKSPSLVVIVPPWVSFQRTPVHPESEQMRKFIVLPVESVTGAPPAVHGISGNYYLNDQGEAVVMTGPALLRSRTILAEFADAGARVVSVTAKDKLRRQLGKPDNAIADCSEALRTTSLLVPVPEVTAYHLRGMAWAARGDLDKAIAHGLSHAPVKGIMRSRVATVDAAAPLAEVQEALAGSPDGRVAVLEDGVVVGVVTRSDLLRAIGERPEVEVEPHGFLEPYLGPSSGPFADAAGDALKYGFGRKPVFIREGGSIGAVVSMARVFKAPVMLMGLSLPEHSYHGPDEHFDWGQASGGMKAFGRYFERVAEI
jgi:CBS domain-containing protein